MGANHTRCASYAYVAADAYLSTTNRIYNPHAAELDLEVLVQQATVEETDEDWGLVGKAILRLEDFYCRGVNIHSLGPKELPSLRSLMATTVCVVLKTTGEAVRRIVNEGRLLENPEGRGDTNIHHLAFMSAGVNFDENALILQNQEFGRITLRLHAADWFQCTMVGFTLDSIPAELKMRYHPNIINGPARDIYLMDEITAKYETDYVCFKHSVPRVQDGCYYQYYGFLIRDYIRKMIRPRGYLSQFPIG